MTELLQTVDRVDRGLTEAAAALFARLRADGSWQDRLPSSAVSTATSVVALHATDRSRWQTPIVTGSAWLVGTQQADGGWGDAVGSPSTINGTALAVAALRLVRAEPVTGLPVVDTAIHRAEAWLKDAGGLPAVADPARCTLSVIAVNHLALTGVLDPASLKRVPFELLLLPRALRQKLSFTVPGLAAFGTMHARTRRFGPLRRALNRLAERAALRYLDGIQRLEGYVGGYQESPLMASVVCFGLARAGSGPAIVERCARYLEQTQRPDGSWPVNRDLELSATTFVTAGLAEAGFTEDDGLGRTTEWIRRCQRDESFFPTGAPPGGWGWSLPSGWPNVDDTADAVLALTGAGARADDPAVVRGVAWLVAMQSRNGSWGCFTRNGAVSLDAPTPEMTAHALLAFRAAGHAAEHPAVVAGLRWLKSVQRSDGSFPSMWYREFTSGTGAALEALGRLGQGGGPEAARARQWLVATQLPDGGWGDGQGSPASAEETAWALLGLLAAGDGGDPAVTRGVEWLLDAQGADGLWSPTLLGVYFSGLLYHDDLIAAGYALQALGRWRRARADG